MSHASHLGHHRTRAAAVPPQPDADRHVDGLSDRAARRARLRVRRQRQAPQGRRRRSGPRRAGGPGPRAGSARSPAARRRSTRSTTPTRGRRWPTCATAASTASLTIPPDFSRRVLARQRAARRADRGQHRQLRRRRTLAATVGGLVTAYNQPAADAPRVAGQATLDVVEVYPYVPYIQYLLPGLDRDVDLHDGDDRRRHHLHRRQGARAARGLPRDADHEARADRRLQPLGDDQGRAGRRRADDDRLAHRGHSRTRSIRCGCSGCSWSSS